MEKRVPTKTIWETVGFMVPRFARAVLRSGSSGSGLKWLRPHMALAIDHVRVMQRVAGPEA